jgi:hypothetical protein
MKCVYFVHVCEFDHFFSICARAAAMFIEIGAFHINCDDNARSFNITCDNNFACKLSVNNAKSCSLTDVKHAHVINTSERFLAKDMHKAYVNRSNEVYTKFAREYASFGTKQLNVVSSQYSREVSQPPLVGGVYNAAPFKNMERISDEEDCQRVLGTVIFTWEYESQTLFIAGNR